MGGYKDLQLMELKQHAQVHSVKLTFISSRNLQILLQKHVREPYRPSVSIWKY
jgi:hypothetical protein